MLSEGLVLTSALASEIFWTVFENLTAPLLSKQSHAQATRMEEARHEDGKANLQAIFKTMLHHTKDGVVSCSTHKRTCQSGA